MRIMCANLSYTYPEQSAPVFEDVSFSLSDDSRLGVIGPNGSGKTTLLGLLTGKLVPTSGTLFRFLAGCAVAHIALDPGDRRLVSASALSAWRPELGETWQIMQEEPDSHAGAEAAAAFSAAGGYAVLAEVQRTLEQYEITEELWNRATSSLSTGERLWLRVAEATLSGARLLLLDEPTSHLDIRKRAELATMLQGMDRPYVVVSHDRRFLDLVCTQILELSRGHGRLYAGGYTDYMAAVRAQEGHDQDVYDTQTRKVRQLKRAIGGIREQAGRIETLAYRTSSGFFSHKAARMEKRARAMRRQLERSLAEAEEAKPFVEKKRVFAIDAIPRGGILASLEAVSATAGGRVLFRDLSMTIRGGDHWCVLGPNGAGKSTLLNVLLGTRKPDTGKAARSPSANIGFVPQHVALLHGDDRPIDLVRSTGGIGKEDARTLLGTLGIEDDQAFQPVGTLSAGQQKRVFIARIIAGAPDLLVIDELEGNLAIDAVVQLEQALSAFRGALVMVTHDAALARAVGREFLTLDGRGGWSRDTFPTGELPVEPH